MTQSWLHVFPTQILFPCPRPLPPKEAISAPRLSPTLPVIKWLGQWEGSVARIPVLLASSSVSATLRKNKYLI